MEVSTSRPGQCLLLDTTRRGRALCDVVSWHRCASWNEDVYGATAVHKQADPAACVPC